MRRIAVVSLCVFVLAGVVGRTSADAATHTWAAFRIGPMEPCALTGDCDDDNTGWDINAKGWVAGDAFPDFHWPWVWKQAASPALLSPGHTAFPGFTDTGFMGINSAGDTTGYADDFNEGGDEVHALLDKGGVITDLGTLQAGGAGFAFGQELNDSDTVVGGSSTSGETVFHAFVWTQATGMVDLGTLGGSQSFANSVNGASQIVGWADTASGRQHAFLDQSGHMTDLGTLGGAQSEARSINLSGEIVGWADTAGGKQDAFIRTGSNLVDIGRLLTDATSSVANDVDNNGDVVGTAQTATGEYSWLYIGGRMINITRNTVTCCDIVGGALNKTLQITERGDLTSAYVPVLEPATVYDELNGRIVYRGTWSRTARAGAWGGHIKSSTANGASATFTFTGRRVWWVAPVGSGFGVAKLYLDGAFQRTVNLGQGFGRRAPVYQRGFPAVGSHTLRIVVSGSGAKVSVDAFAVSQT